MPYERKHQLFKRFTDKHGRKKAAHLSDKCERGLQTIRQDPQCYLPDSTKGFFSVAPETERFTVIKKIIKDLLRIQEEDELLLSVSKEAILFQDNVEQGDYVEVNASQISTFCDQFNSSCTFSCGEFQCSIEAKSGSQVYAFMDILLFPSSCYNVELKTYVIRLCDSCKCILPSTLVHRKIQMVQVFKNSSATVVDNLLAVLDSRSSDASTT